MSFGIEIVDAYKTVKKDNTINNKKLSLHVYVALFDLNIKGIMANKTSKGWFILLPSCYNFDQKKRRMVRFPFLDFTNTKRKTEFIKEIQSNFIDFMDKKVFDDQESETTQEKV
jgi:hypothetical protein